MSTTAMCTMPLAIAVIHGALQQTATTTRSRCLALARHADVGGLSYGKDISIADLGVLGLAKLVCRRLNWSARESQPAATAAGIRSR